MNETLPWYKSAIIRQQIVQLIVAVMALVGVTTDIDWNATVEAIFAGIAAVVAVWTVITRLFKPAPNLTATAVAKERELIEKGKIPDTSPNQGGFARIGLLLILAILTAGILAACKSPPTNVVQVACDPAALVAERCAKGIAETWEVYQKRAEEIVTDPSTPANVKEPIQRAEADTRPAIVEMLKSAAAYKRIKDEIATGSTQEEQLQIANANLEQWVKAALPRIDALGAALGL
jgi:hypothetical protein